MLWFSNPRLHKAQPCVHVFDKKWYIWPIISEYTAPIFTKFSILVAISVEMINMTFILWSLKGQYYGNQLILAVNSENWHTPTSFLALAFHNGLENRNANEHINTGDVSSTSCRNLVRFSTVTPLFMKLVLGCFAAGQHCKALHWSALGLVSYS